MVISSDRLNAGALLLILLVRWIVNEIIMGVDEVDLQVLPKTINQDIPQNWSFY